MIETATNTIGTLVLSKAERRKIMRTAKRGAAR